MDTTSGRASNWRCRCIEVDCDSLIGFWELTDRVDHILKILNVKWRHIVMIPEPFKENSVVMAGFSTLLGHSEFVNTQNAGHRRQQRVEKECCTEG